MAKYIEVNGVELKTIVVNGKEVEYDIEKFVAQYQLRKTLPSTKIVCTKTGNLITAFGPNLHGKVEKYGGIENLLTTFVCKAAGGVMRGPGAGSSQCDTVESVTKRLAELKDKLEVLKKKEKEELLVMKAKVAAAEAAGEFDDVLEEEEVSAE